MQPASWLFNREPWESPQYDPGSPHNIPRREDQRTTSPGFSGETASVREAHRYASLITVSLPVDTVSIKFLDAPIGKRNMLGFRNASTGGQNLFIEFNGIATAGAWLALTPGTIVLFDTVVPQDDLYVIASAAGGVLAFAYSTFPG